LLSHATAPSDMMENLSKSIPNDKAGDQDRTKNDMKSPKEFFGFPTNMAVLWDARDGIR
jgi:hypothetical protein